MSGDSEQAVQPDGGQANVRTINGVQLPFPSEDWPGFLRNHFGPSVMWALMAIGSSHIILAPTMGARYGLFAIWLVTFIFLVKWGAWELGIRYNYGTGKNPVEGYENLPGPGQWGQWLTFFIYLVFWTVITGAVAGGAASFMNAILPEVAGIGMSFFSWYVVLVALIATLVFLSRYEWLETLLKGFVVLLGGLIILGVALAPPSLQVASESAFAVPDVTDPIFIALFVGAAAYMPVGLSSTVSIGSWSMAKKQGARRLKEEGIDPKDPEYREYVESWMRTGMRDYNLGFGFTFLLIVCVIILATNTLWVAGEIPEGGGVPIAIGGILEASYGGWANAVMLIGAVAALVSTMVVNIDAVSRVCSDTLAMVRDDVEDTEPWRRGLVVFVALGTVVPILLIGEFPVILITFSAALIAVFQVFFYVANYYIVREELPEDLQPSIYRKVYYGFGTVVVFVFGVMGALNEFGLVGA